MSIKPEAARLFAEIRRLLAARDITAYIVGGFVRDALQGRDTADIDIAVAADALEVARQAADTLGGHYVPLDDVNLVGRVILPEGRWQVDFTTLKGTIEEDLAERDFTIDAMAYELTGIVSGLDPRRVIDPFNGRQDLQNHLVKAFNESSLRADAVRLLRAFRIAAELGFAIDAATRSWLSRDSGLISGVAGERIREELLRLLSVRGSAPYIFLMDKLGLLTALVPELLPARGVDQPREHVWDVYEHSLQTVAALEFILREAGWEYGGADVLALIPWSGKIIEHFDREVGSGRNARALLKLAALLHDIAKPQTKSMDEGRARFLGHQEQGAAITADIMSRLRFSNREIQLVSLLVKYHLRPTQMSNEGLPTNRAVYRFFRDCGEAGIDVLFLSLADHLAARGPSLLLSEFSGHARMTEYVLQKHFEEKGIISPPKIIDGHDVMQSLGLTAGPAVGELLEALKEAQAAGEITDRPGALKYLEKLYDNMRKSNLN